MRIYILRHEDRTQDCSFFAPLTEKGLNNSVKLIEYLKKLNITKIYCSPFIRTLQTIYPFVKEVNSTNSDFKINLEYGLSEIHNQDLIPPKAVGISLPEYLAKSFCCNLEYKSIIKPANEINYPEKDKDVCLRVKRVLKKIIEEHSEINANILLVSHQSVCAHILKIVNRGSTELDCKLEPTIITNYEKGKLSLVYENGWTYKSIN